MECKRIAVDTSKSVFTVHGIDGQDRPVLRRNLKRVEFEALFAKLAPTEVALEPLRHRGLAAVLAGRGVRGHVAVRHVAVEVAARALVRVAVA